jgi:hypothetical protein
MEYSLAGKLDVAEWMDWSPTDSEDRLTVPSCCETASDGTEAGLACKLTIRTSRRLVENVFFIGYDHQFVCMLVVGFAAEVSNRGPQLAFYQSHRGPARNPCRSYCFFKPSRALALEFFLSSSAGLAQSLIVWLKPTFQARVAPVGTARRESCRPVRNVRS